MRIGAWSLGLVGAAVSCASIAGQPALTPEAEQAWKTMLRFGVEAAPAKAEGTFRVCTYNVENLFDAQDDPALSGRNDDLPSQKPEEELASVARAIRAVDADVLCLQEVESLGAITEFRDNYLSDMGYEHIASIDAGGPRGIEQSVLSRFPIEHVENKPNLKLGGVHPEKYGNAENWHAGEPIELRRSPLRVDVSVPQGEGETQLWTLFVVHHKSGRYSGYWRDKEAAAVVEWMEDATSGDEHRPVLVLGDFNATVDQDSVKKYLGAGMGLASAEGHETAVTHESGRQIDLILANEAALAQVVAGSAFVFGTPARPEGVSYRDLDTFPGYAADHYPVAVDVKLGR